jgi:uncharacterized protein (TIGR02646 family)
MRKADRNLVKPPDVLSAPDSKGFKERENARLHIADPVKRQKAFGFSVYKDDAVKAALHALFHGKCAYCESYFQAQAPVDVEHFRPKAAVEDDKAHPGYWWLAMEWSNLLPSCIDCNRRRRQETPVPTSSLAELHEAATRTANTGKKDAFPVAGARAAAEVDDIDKEQAYLIDPTRDDPADYLEYYIDHDRPIGLILPKTESGSASLAPAIGPADEIVAAAKAKNHSERGAVSIQIYGLNRLGLVQERTRILRRLEFLRHMILEIERVSKDLGKSRAKSVKLAAQRLDSLVELIIAEMTKMAEPEQPYSAMVEQWIGAYKKELRS